MWQGLAFKIRFKCLFIAHKLRFFPDFALGLAASLTFIRDPLRCGSYDSVLKVCAGRGIDPRLPRLMKKVLAASALLFALVSGTATATQSCAPIRIDQQAIVASVVDGDTVRLDNGDAVRLIGINAPEIGRDGKPSEPFSRKSQRRLRALLRAHDFIVNLDHGVESRDRYGRRLAHVYLPDKRNIGEILLSEGLAVRIAVPPNLTHQGCYRQSETAARDRRIGLWSRAVFWDLDTRPLSPGVRGFRLLEGTVARLRRSSKGISFSLSNSLNVLIASADIDYFPAALLGALEHRRVRVRGWISHRQQRPGLRLRHPASLELLP